MKELALLMFFVGCGYALTQLISRFSKTQTRRFYFRIPSTASYNIIWGFIFYLGFGILTASHLWLKIIMAAAALLLFAYLVRLQLISKYLTEHHPAFMAHTLSRQLNKQLTADDKFGHSYTPADALHILGLPPTLSNTDDKIIARLTLIENLPLPETELSGRNALLSRLRQALAEK